MSNNSSTFPRFSKEIDCGNAPDYAVLYDGTTTGNPTVATGVLSFVGGISLQGSRGIGYGLRGQEFAIPFQSILPGGGGVKVVNCTTKENKRVRFKCCGAECGDTNEEIVLQLTPIQVCEDPKWEVWQFDYRIVFDPACGDSCEIKLNKLAEEINTRDDEQRFIATVLQDANNDWVLDITSVDGSNFRINYFSGLIGGDDIIGYHDHSLYASKMQQWFGKEIYDRCAADDCFNYVEIRFEESWNESGHAMTSRFSGDTYTQGKKLRTVIVVFSSTATTQRTNLLTELYAAGSKFDAKTISATPAVSIRATYDYVIVREDAGNDTALTAVNTAYTAEIVPITRAKYKDGISYYVLTTASATAPTAVNDDQIFQGVYVDGLFEACPPVTT